MIISHKLKIIYIRLQKVASTSFEAALSRYCGPDDVIVKLGRGHDEKRKNLGYRSVQNIKFGSGKKDNYKPHNSATVIKRRVSAELWDSYMKIATIRNPYDTMVSIYYDKYFRKNKARDETITFGEYVTRIGSSRNGRITRFLYDGIHIEGKSVIDFYIRYEHLHEDIKKLEVEIGCAGLLETMEQFSFNKNVRSDNSSLYEMYSQYPEAKSLIDEDLYENLDKYELLREHWPMYKSELEKILHNK